MQRRRFLFTLSGITLALATRLFAAPGNDKVHGGIEMLAKKHLSVWLRIIGKGAEQVSNREASPGFLEYDYLHVIPLPDTHNSYLNATMLMESGSYAAG
jgi:hypothetical protein